MAQVLGCAERRAVAGSGVDARRRDAGGATRRSASIADESTADDNFSGCRPFRIASLCATRKRCSQRPACGWPTRSCFAVRTGIDWLPRGLSISPQGLTECELEGPGLSGLALSEFGWPAGAAADDQRKAMEGRSWGRRAAANSGYRLESDPGIQAITGSHRPSRMPHAVFRAANRFRSK